MVHNVPALRRLLHPKRANLNLFLTRKSFSGGSWNTVFEGDLLRGSQNQRGVVGLLISNVADKHCETTWRGVCLNRGGFFVAPY